MTQLQQSLKKKKFSSRHNRHFVAESKWLLVNLNMVGVVLQSLIPVTWFFPQLIFCLFFKMIENSQISVGFTHGLDLLSSVGSNAEVCIPALWCILFCLISRLKFTFCSFIQTPLSFVFRLFQVIIVDMKLKTFQNTSLTLPPDVLGSKWPTRLLSRPCGTFRPKDSRMVKTIVS